MNRISCFTLLFSFLFSAISLGQEPEVRWVYPDGIPRIYNLYVPPGYDPATPLPLVINIHGWVATGRSFMRSTSDLRPLADTANFLIAYPTGENFRWNSLEEENGARDIRFLTAMLDDIEADFSVDRKRIYATGHNDGGELAHLLGCLFSDRIAAVASVKGSISTKTLKDGCVTSRPVPILKIHNTNDWLTPFYGDERRAPVSDQIDLFTENNGCRSAPQWSVLPDIDPGDSITVERYVYTDCAECADVELILELDSTMGLSYDYPISTPEAPYYFDAREEIWRFFRKYTIEGGCRTTSTEDVLIDQLRLYPNPAYDQLFLETTDFDRTDFTIFSALGRTVLSGVLATDSPVLDISGLPPGVYYLQVGTVVLPFIKNQ